MPVEADDHGQIGNEGQAHHHGERRRDAATAAAEIRWPTASPTRKQKSVGMSISISPEVAALLGALIGSLPSLIARYMEGRVRAKEQMRELAVRAAIEGWKVRATLPGVTAVPPLEHAILHAAKMSELAFSDEKLTPEQVADRLKEVGALMDALAEHAQAVRRHARGQ